jgi:ankyrin repeat protein
MISPLIEAVCRGDFETSQALLAQGADATVHDTFGLTALSHAVKIGSYELFQLLLPYYPSYSISKDSLSLIHAVEMERIDIVEEFLKRGADPGTKFGSSSTLLIRAVEKQDLPMVRLLLKYGASVNTSDEKPSALMHAIFQGNRSIVKCLLDHDANTNLSVTYNNIVCYTPLIQAVTRRRSSIVEQLLQYGADVNAIDEKGNSAIMIAAKNNDVPMVSLLLQYAPDVNIQNKKGCDAKSLTKSKEVRLVLKNYESERYVLK